MEGVKTPGVASCYFLGHLNLSFRPWVVLHFSQYHAFFFLGNLDFFLWEEV